MPYELIHLFKQHVWEKIQEDIQKIIQKRNQKDVTPNSGQINYIVGFERDVSVSWDITKNALTSDIDISVFIEGLPEDNSKEDTSFIDVQISISRQDNCLIESTDVNITNWSEALDSEYNDLSEKIQKLWNTT